MHQPLPRSCDLCGAIVSGALMAFHLDWHTARRLRHSRSGEADKELTVGQLRRTSPGLNATPWLLARQELVADLFEHRTSGALPLNWAWRRPVARFRGARNRVQLAGKIREGMRRFLQWCEGDLYGSRYDSGADLEDDG